MQAAALGRERERLVKDTRTDVKWCVLDKLSRIGVKFSPLFVVLRTFRNKTWGAILNKSAL